MLAAGFERMDQFRRALASLTVGVPITPQAAIAHAKEIISLPEEAHCSILRRCGEFQCAVGPAISVVIDKQADVPAPGDDDAPLRIERHAIDVVRQRTVGELRRLETLRQTQAMRRRLRIERRQEGEKEHGQRQG